MLPLFIEEEMFTLIDSIKIVTIDQTYMKSLYDVCDQVFYMPSSYVNKPYLGILISSNGREYAIPLTSAKEKHKTWKNYSNGKFLIYEMCDLKKMTSNDIWVNNPDDSTGTTVKHILAALIIPKMIPIKKGTYQVVNINVDPTDTVDIINYKNLLNKEFAFCVSIKDKLIKEAGRIYDRQIKTSKIFFGYCDFQALEKACDSFSVT